MTVTVKDLWKFKNKQHLYGYCTCGREVILEKHKTCPMCGAKLDWNVAAGKIRVI